MSNDQENSKNRSKEMCALDNQLANMLIEYQRKKDRIDVCESDISSVKASIDGTLTEVTSLISQVRSRYEELSSYVNQLKTLQTNVNEELTKIRENYEEQMKMSEPASVWEKQIKWYGKLGVLYIFLAVVACISFGLLLYSLLINADVFPVFNVTKFDFSTVRSSLVLLLFASLFGIVIHILFKMAISSFHLSRDANERRQLTYYYLSLTNVKGSVFDDKAKQIMLNSIFARSDSGLLKGCDGTVTRISIGDLLTKE